MSRSLHTQKWQARAERRLAQPYASRREEGRRLKVSATAKPTPRPVAIRTAIKMCKPLPGYVHPLRARDIHELAASIGIEAFYGVKVVRMRRECVLTADRLVFGEYVLPGEIHLYAVPRPPWVLPFRVASQTLTVFARYGARYEIDPIQSQTTIEWKDAGLRAFYRLEVLAHELGHHHLQHHKGKRPVSICRRCDHELRADLHSRRTTKRLLSTYEEA